MGYNTYFGTGQKDKIPNFHVEGIPIEAIAGLPEALVKVKLVAGAAAYNAGRAQVETATVVGTITTAGAGKVVVTSTGMAGSPLTIAIPGLEVEDDAAAIAGKIRAVLAANATIKGKFTVGGTDAAVVLTAKAKAANDDNLNIAISDGEGEGACEGITTAASSANTTTGVAPVSGAVDLADAPTSVIAVFAFTTASGAVATKCLLAPTTDYTVNGSTLTCVTDQSANTLLVIYRP